MKTEYNIIQQRNILFGQESVLHVALSPQSSILITTTTIIITG